MMLVRAYPRETQEMVFDAHERAFAFFKGACSRGVYDNMKTAVETIFIGKAEVPVGPGYQVPFAPKDQALRSGGALPIMMIRLDQVAPIRVDQNQVRHGGVRRLQEYIQGLDVIGDVAPFCQ